MFNLMMGGSPQGWSAPAELREFLKALFAAAAILISANSAAQAGDAYQPIATTKAGKESMQNMQKAMANGESYDQYMQEEEQRVSKELQALKEKTKVNYDSRVDTNQPDYFGNIPGQPNAASDAGQATTQMESEDKAAPIKEKRTYIYKPEKRTKVPPRLFDSAQ